MADTKISALTGASTPLAGTEVLPIVQSGTTVKVAVSDLTAGRSVSASNFVPTSSSATVNGMYLPAANTVAINANSLTGLYVDSSGNSFVAGRTSTATTATGSYFFAGSGILAQGRVNGGDVQRFFCTDNGNQVGSITVSTAATAFNITSDQRLKNDLGIVTTTNVIRDTKIHDYEWKNIGVQGRGVFAQEAVLVKPDAVSKGELDGLDENGRPTNPWSVDYSKYIPDLIVYCQELERRIAALETPK
jgi:hypothetical protein